MRFGVLGPTVAWTDDGAVVPISGTKVRALLTRGPLSTEEAKQAKLIDQVGYADEVVAAAKKQAGSGVRTLPLPDYYAQNEHEARGALAEN